MPTPRKYHNDEERRLAANERQRRSRLKNKERHQAVWNSYAYTPKGRVTALLRYARGRASWYSLPFDLDRDWVEEKIRSGYCEVSGLAFVFDRPSGESRLHPFGPSIDKIDPKGGYLKTNCRMVCFAVNAAKQDWDDKVLLTVAKAITERNTK